MSTQNSDFPDFLNAYLRTALWSSTINEGTYDEPGERDGESFDRYFSPKDFDSEALEILRAHCLSFWSQTWYYISHEKPAQDASQAGQDFWLTSNGHGSGFWDGDWKVYGDMLTKMAKCYPEINLTITSEGKVGI